MQEQLWVALLKCEDTDEDPSDFLELHHSCIENLVTFVNGNIDDDPLFVNPAVEDFRLPFGSPAIDAGSVNPVAGKVWDDFPLDRFDIDRDGIRDGVLSVGAEYAPDLRPINRVYPAVSPSWPVDMGAYEFRCRFDLDGDGDVGASDLAQVLGTWGACEGGCAADFDNDGDVDAADLAVLLGAWGSTVECDVDWPLPIAPVALLTGFGEEFESSSTSAPIGMAPSELADLFGFDSLESFSEWLAGLTAAHRAAVLALLSDESQGGW